MLKMKRFVPASFVLLGLLLSCAPAATPQPQIALATATIQVPTVTPLPTLTAFLTATRAFVPTITLTPTPEDTLTPTITAGQAMNTAVFATLAAAPRPTDTPTYEKVVPLIVPLETMTGPANFHPSKDYADNLLKSFPFSQTGDTTIAILVFVNGRSSYNRFVAGEPVGDGSTMSRFPVKFFDITNCYIQQGESYLEFDMTNAHTFRVHVIMKVKDNPAYTNINQGGKLSGAWFYQAGNYKVGQIQPGDKVGYLEPALINQAANNLQSPGSIRVDGTGGSGLVEFNGQ